MTAKKWGVKTKSATLKLKFAFSLLIANICSQNNGFASEEVGYELIPSPCLYI
jgi:hypothetical protein